MQTYHEEILHFSWVEDGWKMGTEIDVPLSQIDHAVFSPHGALAANSTHIVYSRDGLHFKKAAHGPAVDLLPEGEKRLCHPSRESWGRYKNGPMLLVTENGFIALTPAHADNWHRTPFCEPLLWFSEAGSDWHLISDESPFGKTGYIHDIFHIEDRFVALGGQDSHGGAVWLSDDGLTWDMADVRAVDTSAIAAAEVGWMLVGHSFIWMSKDGYSWHGPHTLPRDLQHVYSIPPTLGIWSDTIFGGSVNNPVLGKITGP